ncbi:endoplasmic reticulum metallopeptidase 1-like [Saccoglossus kowalevskii]
MADTNQRRKRGERNGGRKDAATVKHVVKRYRSSLPEVYLLVVLVMFGGNLAAVVWSYSWLPEPRVVSTVDSDSIRSPDAVGEFYEHRARKHLDILTSFGPRTTGSVENEEMAFRYILKELNKIKPHPQKKYEKDVQRPEGSFSLHLIKDFSNYYRNVTNIIARVGPGETAMSPGKKNKKTRPSLLVNCHFDSVPDSPGASDDAGSCAVLLEILRILVESDEPLKHSVIFLFNGAEENILHASHGFITNHQWRKDIKAFLNFESAGSGGREVVFQTGPHHPWLVHAYAATAKYPLANSFAQDLFQSGVIPADTDFRIFRDYGDVPGIDMAYVTNGYVYHTEYDEPQRIYPGSLQAAGDNILALIKHIANSPYLEDPEEYRHGDMIYFDVLGFFLVAYPVRIATLLNGCILLYVLTSIWQRVLANEDEYEGPVGLSYLFHLLLAVGIISFSWCLSFLVTITIGYLLSMAGYGMFWFTSNSLIFGVYGCPALLTLISVHIIAKHYFYKKRFTNLWEVESIYFDATLLLWMSFLAVATAKHSMSSYILLMWVAFPVVFRRLTSLFFSDHLNAMPPRLFFGSHTVSLVIPTLMSMYIIWMLFLLVLPITGRIGSVVKPDLLIAALLTFAVVSCTSYLMSLVYVLRRLEGTYLVLSIMFLTMLGITVATPYGFPYGGNPLYPTPKRMFTQVSVTQFYLLQSNLNSMTWVSM